MIYPLRIFVSAALILLVGRPLSGQVLLEVDLRENNRITFNATEGDSLVTQSLNSTSKLLVFDDLLRGVEVGGGAFGTRTLSSGGTGDLTYAQAPGTPFDLLFGSGATDGAFLRTMGGVAEEFTAGERALIGSRSFALSASDYDAILGDVPLTGDLFSRVNPLFPTPADARIGEYEVLTPGFLGRSIGLEVQVVGSSNGVRTSERFEAVVDNGTDEFAGFEDIQLFTEAGFLRSRQTTVWTSI